MKKIVDKVEAKVDEFATEQVEKKNTWVWVLGGLGVVILVWLIG